MDMDVRHSKRSVRFGEQSERSGRNQMDDSELPSDSELDPRQTYH